MSPEDEKTLAGMRMIAAGVRGLIHGFERVERGNLILAETDPRHVAPAIEMARNLAPSIQIARRVVEELEAAMDKLERGTDQ